MKSKEIFPEKFRDEDYIKNNPEQIGNLLKSLKAAEQEIKEILTVFQQSQFENLELSKDKFLVIKTPTKEPGYTLVNELVPYLPEGMKVMVVTNDYDIFTMDKKELKELTNEG